MIRLPLLRLAVLALLILYPISWFAPLLRTGFLRPRTIPWTDWTLFELEKVSVISGLQELWGSSPFLAMIVTAAAIFFPMLKLIGTGLMQFDLLSPRLAPALDWIGKFAMADIFLIALYVLIFKSMGVGQVETGWGLYLFTFCVIASIVVSALSKRAVSPTG